MENSPLNKAHQLIRRAEALQKQFKFDESIDVYRNAIMYLYDALPQSENVKSKESIELQIEYYQKQVETLKVKKAQYEDLKRYQESVKSRAATFEAVSSGTEILSNDIFRTIVNHDSLIELLIKRPSEEDYLIKDSPSLNISGTKRQVDDSTQLEEYRVLSAKLREVVQVLLMQIDEKDCEIGRLKLEISRLKCEQKKDAHTDGNSLKVITDSSGGTSPYVFSPCSELSPEVQSTRDLSSLPPLEMPNIDFASLIKDTTTFNLNNSN